MPVERGTMTDETKNKIALGRTQGAAVRKYLAALNGTTLRVSDVDTRLRDIKVELLEMEDDPDLDVMKRLKLVRERRALEERTLPPIDQKKAEAEFIAVASDYSQRTGTTYDDWIEMGVQPSVLKKAGL